MNFRTEDSKDFMVKFLSSFVDLSEADFVTEKVEQVVEETDAEFGLQTIMKLNSKMREKLECSELDDSSEDLNVALIEAIQAAQNLEEQRNRQPRKFDA